MDVLSRSQVEVVPPGRLDSLLTKAVTDYLVDRQPLDVLDAGCGRMWSWDLGLDFRLTGVDDDADALRLRQETTGDLTEAIVSDLRTVDLRPETYDLVHCAYVLEHVNGADQVLDRMRKALAPGGVMVLKIPDRASVYA